MNLRNYEYCIHYSEELRKGLLGNGQIRPNSEPAPRHDILQEPKSGNRGRYSIFMLRLITLSLFLIFALNPPLTRAQTIAKTEEASSAGEAQHALDMAAKGRCREALPLLQRSAAQNPKKDLRYNLEMATARCAMSVSRADTAVEALLQLNREFPHDPEVLYLTTHFYGELASRAAQDLAATAPNSAQAQQLEAESYESHEQWDKAQAAYEEILQKYPNRRGIHYQLGRIFLSKDPPEVENADKEFQEELKIDPDNASAQFMLGESARQAGQWGEAVARFSKAAELDAGFDEAYLALGMSLNAEGKFADAITSLETYVKREPGDPAGHYQLAIAYARTGHKQQAAKEMELQQQTAAKAPKQLH
jgi:predicted Zn-dependent protease